MINSQENVEQLARRVYQDLYKIAEIRQSGEYTENLRHDLHMAFANQIDILPEEHVSPEAYKLAELLHNLEDEFYKKFQELEEIQKLEGH